MKKNHFKKALFLGLVSTVAGISMLGAAPTTSSGVTGNGNSAGTSSGSNGSTPPARSGKLGTLPRSGTNADGTTGTNNNSTTPTNNGTIMENAKPNDIQGTPTTGATLRGQVQSMNQADRTVVVRDAQGNLSTITINDGTVFTNKGKNPSNFSTIRAGDNINYINDNNQVTSFGWDNQKSLR